MGKAFPSDALSLERCPARSVLHALLEEKMALLCVWRPGRAEHLWISPPSLHEVEELKAFPGVVCEEVSELRTGRDDTLNFSPLKP
jgi:hypothetical protein